MLLYGGREQLTFGAESKRHGPACSVLQVAAGALRQCRPLSQNAHSPFVRLYVGANRYLIPCFIERSNREFQRDIRGHKPAGGMLPSLDRFERRPRFPLLGPRAVEAGRCAYSCRPAVLVAHSPRRFLESLRGCGRAKRVGSNLLDAVHSATARSN